MEDFKKDLLVIELTKLVYDTSRLKDKSVQINLKTEVIELICIDIIDETSGWFNGLQAAAYLSVETNIIFVSVK